MHEDMRAAMREAARLTQAGRLDEATALIHQTLRGASGPESRGAHADPATSEIIEGTYRVLDPSPAIDLSNHSAPPRLASPLKAPSPGHGPGEQLGQREHVRQAAAPAPALRAVPAVGQFLSGSYTGRAGTRSYTLYVPSGYRGQALPLVVMLHGCTQSPDDFATGTRMNMLAEEQLFFVAYPAQASSANRAGCWNWFQAADQQRAQGEPALIAGITREVLQTYQIDARRVYVAGLSAGGAMAVVMGVTYPDLYAAVGVHSGLPYGAAHDLPSALAAMQRGRTHVLHKGAASAMGARARLVPTIVFHGDQDTTVHQRNGEAVIAQAAAHEQEVSGPKTAPKLRMRIQRSQAPGGRSYTRAIYRDAGGQTVLEQWLIHGAGHAWSGGSPAGSFTDPGGPNASLEMVRFFAEQSQAEAG